MSAKRKLSIAMVAILVATSRASAQSIEISGGIDLVLTNPATTYETRYVPPVQFITEFDGEAGQTLSLHRKRQPPVWGAIAWFPSSQFGFEARVRYRTGPLQGTSGEHRLSLTYTSRQPPDNVPRQHTITRSEAQPDPGGKMRELSIAVLGVGRFGDPERLQVRIGGGLAFLFLDGQIEAVNFAHYQLGGHSTLFGSDNRITLDLERTSGVSAIATFDLHRAFTPHLGLLVGGHWLFPQAFELPARVTAVQQDGLTPSVEYVEEWLQPGPLRIRPWTADLTLGLRVTF